jgi:hypothetical protein
MSEEPSALGEMYRQGILSEIFDLSKWQRPCDDGRETYLQTSIELGDLILYAHAIAVVEDESGVQVAEDLADQPQLDGTYAVSCMEEPLHTIPWNGREYVIAITS